MKDMYFLTQESEKTQNRIKSKKSTPGHMIIKLPKTKDKENNLESLQREIMHYLLGKKIQMPTHFSSETTEARRKYCIFQMVKE